MSRQIMYRRLKDENVSFAETLDALRHRLAADYIRSRKISVNQTAYLVGSSEPSSFVRAFKRWAGMTPARFRAS
ncbi:AraC family transcriptional regulator [Sedimentitalea sp.]|uniref:AraC family transcriptional regulator n=1 Tax=Sedimentitalea sp. TaxID=2048915 RepID=UPI003299D795